MTIGVLDYGAGNLKNVCRAIEHLGYKYKLVSCKQEILNVDKLIIPGVGAFKVAMEQLKELDLIISIAEVANKGVPILGICLGMQLLFERSSEFGITEGLGLIEGEINLIPRACMKGEQLKVPHIGWNELTVKQHDTQMSENIDDGDAVYFVHSYRAEKFNDSDLVAYCQYGEHQLPAIFQKRNITGCQFHPEKSGLIGLKIFNNFLQS